MIDPCCTLRPDVDRACPACGAPGRRVDRVTVESMLRPRALAGLASSEHRFCATPGCPVVYFGPRGRCGVEDVAVPVFQKEPPGARTICYCFAVTEADIEAELAASGGSTAVERIAALVKNGQCACELKNPQGACCLGNVAAAVEAVRSATGAAARSPRSGGSAIR